MIVEVMERKKKLSAKGKKGEKKYIQIYFKKTVTNL